jgi:hypothetical protein
LSPKEIKKKKLDLLQRLIERVQQYENSCSICSNYDTVIDSIMDKLEDNDSSYLHDINVIRVHMIKTHKLLEEGYHIAIFLILGVLVGVITGLISNNYSMFLALGIASGVAMGTIVENKAKKENKIL